MKKIKYITYAILIILIVVFNLKQFDYTVEAEDLELIIMMGLDSLDRENSGIVRLTYLRNPLEEGNSANNSSNQSEEGEEGSSASNEGSKKTLTIEDKTYSRAMETSQIYTNKLLVGDAIKYFIIGEDTARNGISKEIDFLSRKYELRLSSKVFIAKDMTAEKLLNSADTDLYKKLDNIINSTAQMDIIKKMDLVNLLKSSNSSNTATVIPVLEINDITGTEEINIYGLSIFKNNKLISYLNNEQVIYYSILKDNLKGVNIDIYDEELGYVSVGMTNLDKKISFEFDGNNLSKIKYEIDFLGNIEEMNRQQNLFNDEITSKIESLAAEKVKNNLYDIVNISKDLGADFLRISDIISSKHPSKWENLKEDWDNIIQNIEFNISVNATVTRTYNITNSN